MKLNVVVNAGLARICFVARTRNEVPFTSASDLTSPSEQYPSSHYRDTPVASTEHPLSVPTDPPAATSNRRTTRRRERRLANTTRRRSRIRRLNQRNRTRIALRRLNRERITTHRRRDRQRDIRHLDVLRRTVSHRSCTDDGKSLNVNST